MKKNKKIIFGQPDVGFDEINAINKVIKSKWLGTGPITKKFEEKFRKYKKSKYALAVNSCTAALHLSLITLGIGKGDEVITTPMTFSSTVTSIVHSGATPVLADIDPNTFNINPNLIERKITKKTKAIIVVHLGGLPCDMDEILKIKKKYNLFLIEDCAHAVESKYKNKHTGTFGDAGCFSFYSTKNLSTGEGGMILFKKKNFYKKAKIISLHGLTKDAWKRSKSDNNLSKNFHYDVKEIGFKYNLTDLNSSIGLVQLKKLEKNLTKRYKLFNHYIKKLKYLPLSFQNFDKKKIRHGCHLFIVALNKNQKKTRDKLFLNLTSNKIGCGINYRSITDMSIFIQKFKWNKQTCPNSKYLGDHTISLPLHPKMTIKDVNFICDKIKEFFINKKII